MSGGIGSGGIYCLGDSVRGIFPLGICPGLRPGDILSGFFFTEGFVPGQLSGGLCPGDLVPGDNVLIPSNVLILVSFLLNSCQILNDENI